MSSAPDNLASFGPEWNSRRVPTFAGQHDTHISTGEDYSTITLATLFTMEPGDKPKGEGPAFIPSDYCDYDARNHATQREKGLFVALTGDVDSGNHSLAHIEALVRGIVKDRAFLIYSSAHARPGDMRWRIIIPVETEFTFSYWHDAQSAFFDYMEETGVAMDRALARAAQPVYLPNVPHAHGKTGEPLRGPDGKPLHYERATSGTNAPGITLGDPVLATYIAMLRRKREADDRERERIRAEAAERRAKAPLREGAPIIEDFNRANSIETMFELYGYERSPANSDDWRSPKQTSESYATRVFGDTWVSLSGSDVGARLGATFKGGCYGDAYDLFVHYEHGGDHKSAFRALYQERRASMPMAAQSEPPAPAADDPGWTEPPEGASDMEEVVEAAAEAIAVAAEADTDTFPLLSLAELEALPAPEWLVEDMVVEDGLTVIYGDPGSGKSFIGLDMGLRIALGMDWHGRATKATGVLYIAGEGARGFGKRARGWRLHHKVQATEGPFLLLPVPVAMLQPDQRSKLLRTIDAAIVRSGVPVGLVVIDTVSRALAGAGENGADEMGTFVACCDTVRMHIGGAVLGVHHSGKDKDRGMRGSTVLLGACDGAIRCDKDDDIVTLKTEKQKDAEQAAPIYMKMERIEWGTSEGPESTLVPVHLSRAPDESAGINRSQISEAFGILADAWSEGKPLSSKPQTKRDGRFAPGIFARRIGGTAEAWESLLFSWLENGAVSYELFDRKAKISGLRVMNPIV
jgi:hypothetical protein